MFQEWGFLIGEMVVLIILAALLGVIVGWLVWGRRKDPAGPTEADELRGALGSCQREKTGLQADIDKLRAEVEAARAEASAAIRSLAEMQSDAALAAMAAEEAAGQASSVLFSHGTVSAVVEEAAAEVAPAPAPEAVGLKPATLDAPREGGPDDLKQIKGVGPKLEALIHALGFYHFDQIAGWTEAEVAWVDANLEGFKGRVSRDGWVEQARQLAAGGTTEFADRVKDGEVY